MKRVRGDTWADRCADAERLSKVVEPRSIRERAQRHLEAMQESGNPNAAELTALTVGDKAEWQRGLVEQMHQPPTEEGEDQ